MPMETTPDKLVDFATSTARTFESAAYCEREAAQNMSRKSIRDTMQRIIDERIPNLFRLFINPHVAKACFCLSKFAQSEGNRETENQEDYQVFLANGFDEALSGAIKLARYTANLQDRPSAGLLVTGDESSYRDRLRYFHALNLDDNRQVEFIPSLVATTCETAALASLVGEKPAFGFVVLDLPARSLSSDAFALLKQLVATSNATVISCVDRESLTCLQRQGASRQQHLAADILVFDESFVNFNVAFGAFAARQSLYRPWNQRSNTTFHSTTYQPNTVSTLHFLKCVEELNSRFFESVAKQLQQIDTDSDFRFAQFGRCYNPTLGRLIRTLGFDRQTVSASGHYVSVGNRRLFDGVSGIACSIRGHNPASYVEEIVSLDAIEDPRRMVAECLKSLTGLDHVTPATSGASAVENALKIGLACQLPKKYVVALKGGFGGKTLLALTGTYKSFYKSRLDPLYENVIYVDPFAEHAVKQFQSILQTHPVAVVQIELVQGVGGVRRIPQTLLRFLDEQRQRFGYLLLVDEVQTGFYRTGPFCLSSEWDVSPDLLTLGKGASDMMFPFGMTLHTSDIERTLAERSCDLTREIARQSDYETGYLTVLNTLRQADESRLDLRVRQAGEHFEQLLRDELNSCRAVSDIRVFGLLIGIELARGWLSAWRQRFALLSMMQQRSFPVIVGFCQGEPNVLKLTPPLSITSEEIRQVVATISSVLKKPLSRLVAGGLWKIAKSRRTRKANRKIRG